MQVHGQAVELMNHTTYLMLFLISLILDQSKEILNEMFF